MLRRQTYLMSSYINLNQNVNCKQWTAQSVSTTKGQDLRFFAEKQTVTKYLGWKV